MFFGSCKAPVDTLRLRSQQLRCQAIAFITMSLAPQATAAAANDLASCSCALAGRVALVTGASRGVGRAVALVLARAGAYVIALARSEVALQELLAEIYQLGGGGALMRCDLADLAAVDRIGADIYSRWSKLDILIGNAAILGSVAPLARVDPEVWEEIFTVNVTANWRLIRSLDAALRASDAGRVVLMSSAAAYRPAPSFGPYAASKAALNAIVRTYAAETVNVSPMKVMAADPGPLRTTMRSSAVPKENPALLRTPEDFAPRVLQMCLPGWPHSGTLYDFPRDRILTFEEPGS